MALPNTHHGPDEIAQILKNKKKIFFDGIGGVSMNSLAHISHLRGYEVSGYDRTESAITDKLEAMGIKVYYTASAATSLQFSSSRLITAFLQEGSVIKFRYEPRICSIDLK